MPSADEITLAEYQALVAPGASTRSSGARGKAQNGAQRPTASEHQEQAALIAWADGLAGRLPELGMLFAIPNGGARHIATARRLRAEGVRAGVPDLMLAVARGGWHACFVEMKRADGGRLSPEQRQWHAALTAAGYDVRVCKGWEAAARAILAYLGRRPEEFGL